MIKYETEHLFDKDEKRQYLGEGEWVDEPDLIRFEYEGYQCEIRRMFTLEPYAKVKAFFGGYLCGYVQIPKDHIAYKKHYDDINIDCHGGLTYSEIDKDGNREIGFDCAHSMDYMPSTEHFKRTNSEMIKFREKNPIPEGYKKNPLFNPVYRTASYVSAECMHIVDQLKVLKEVGNGEEKSD